jgi:hypothetical protein
MNINEKLECFIKNNEYDKIKQIIPFIDPSIYASKLILDSVYKNDFTLFDIYINNEDFVKYSNVINENGDSLIELSLLDSNFRMIDRLIEKGVYSLSDIISVSYFMKTYANSDYFFLFKNPIIYNHIRQTDCFKFNKLNEILLTQKLTNF